MNLQEETKLIGSMLEALLKHSSSVAPNPFKSGENIELTGFKQLSIHTLYDGPSRENCIAELAEQLNAEGSIVFHRMLKPHNKNHMSCGYETNRLYIRGIDIGLPYHSQPWRRFDVMFSKV